MFCEKQIGLNCRDEVPIRVEPGLFECPHLNEDAVDHFMSLKEFIDNGYNIKKSYRSIVPLIEVPEFLPDYFRRCKQVIRTMIDRYSKFGGDILIITHAPGLIALTESLRGSKSLRSDFYQVASTIPPLSISIAKYEETKWEISKDPFNVSVPMR